MLPHQADVEALGCAVAANHSVVPRRTPPAIDEPRAAIHQAVGSPRERVAVLVFDTDCRTITRASWLTSCSLEVAQQPVRARMCGFGDKVIWSLVVLREQTIAWYTDVCTTIQDRRPITPPPCIRLVVRDSKTGNEVDFT